MTTTALNIIPAKPAETTQTAQYTSDGVRTIIDKFTATNTSGASVVFSVNLVPSGGVPNSGNLIVSNRVIAAGACYQFSELIGHVLESGSFISTLAGAASAVTIRASGRKITG